MKSLAKVKLEGSPLYSMKGACLIRAKNSWFLSIVPLKIMIKCKTLCFINKKKVKNN